MYYTNVQKSPEELPLPEPTEKLPESSNCPINCRAGARADDFRLGRLSGCGCYGSTRGNDAKHAKVRRETWHYLVVRSTTTLYSILHTSLAGKLEVFKAVAL